jgi:chromo domain-containing protein 1
LIAEESTKQTSPPNTAGISHANSSSANPTPISGPTNGPKTLHLPPQFSGADDQSIDMDLDSPMLVFDGAGDERPTASSSSNSRSGIQSDENGRRFVSRSVRPNASVRPEISVRPGYIAHEDKGVYYIPSRRRSAADTPTNQSAAASPAIASSSNMDVDSDHEGGRGLQKSRWAEVEQRPGSAQSQSEREDGEVEEVQKELKEVKFEATTTWYKRAQKESRGWEHIRVEGFEATRGSLGMRNEK